MMMNYELTIYMGMGKMEQLDTYNDMTEEKQVIDNIIYLLYNLRDKEIQFIKEAK